MRVHESAIASDEFRTIGRYVAVKKKARSVPSEILAKLRAICLQLPEAYEERAWVGTRWRIRKQTFAHALIVESGWPPAYAKVVGSAGPVCIVTCRSKIAELNAHSFAKHPFFRPGWWPDIVGLVIETRTDWDEVAYLLAESYRVMAPKKLAESIAHRVATGE